MIKINEISHLVLDLNGTLALDGQIKPGVGDLLSLARTLSVPWACCCSLCASPRP